MTAHLSKNVLSRGVANIDFWWPMVIFDFSWKGPKQFQNYVQWTFELTHRFSLRDSEPELEKDVHPSALKIRAWKLKTFGCKCSGAEQRTLCSGLWGMSDIANQLLKIVVITDKDSCSMFLTLVSVFSFICPTSSWLVPIQPKIHLSFFIEWTNFEESFSYTMNLCQYRNVSCNVDNNFCMYWLSVIIYAFFKLDSEKWPTFPYLTLSTIVGNLNQINFE